jgi:hypothetical protein
LNSKIQLPARINCPRLNKNGENGIDTITRTVPNKKKNL